MAILTLKELRDNNFQLQTEELIDILYKDDKTDFNQGKWEVIRKYDECVKLFPFIKQVAMRLPLESQLKFYRYDGNKRVEFYSAGCSLSWKTKEKYAEETLCFLRAYDSESEEIGCIHGWYKYGEGRKFSYLVPQDTPLEYLINYVNPQFKRYPAWSITKKLIEEEFPLSSHTLEIASHLS